MDLIGIYRLDARIYVPITGQEIDRRISRVEKGDTLVARQLQLLAVFVFAAVFSNCAAQDISVHLLDARDARPYAHKAVYLQFRSANDVLPASLNAETETNGVAYFHLPDSHPKSVEVLYGDHRLYPCSPVTPVEVDKIAATGVVARCSKSQDGCRCRFGQQVKTLAGTPGQYVLLVRPAKFWERLF